MVELLAEKTNQYASIDKHKQDFDGMLQLIFCIDINTYSDRTGDEKLCKIYFKCFENVLIFIDIFIDIISPLISSTQIAYDVIFVQHVIQ